MSILQLDPPASAYYDDPLDVTITVPEDCIQVILTSDGSNPGIVQTIAASNRYNPPVPYLQSVQDGRGFLVIDGAFPRWYNMHWTTAATTYAALPANNKFMANILLAILNGGTKLLVLGDAAANTVYPTRGTGASGFYTTLTKMAVCIGVQITIKDRNSYPGNYLNPTLSELLEYDAVMVIGSDFTGNTFITTAGAQNIATYRLQGRGLYLVGDHAPNFVLCINRILSYVVQNAALTGNYDFTPGTSIGYNKSLNGDNPLFINLPDSTIIQGDTSNSRVTQPTTQWTPLPTTVHVGDGYTTIKAVIKDCDGNITYEEHGFAVARRPIVLLEEDPVTVLSVRQDIVPLGHWDNKYHNLTREAVDGTPPGLPIWDGGNWFPTTHVEIIANGGLSTISIETLSEFFYEIANYNLVLNSVDADYKMIVSPDGETPATRILAAGLVVDNTIVTSTEGRYGTKPPISYLYTGIPTLVYGSGSMILGRPNAWFKDNQGRKFPIYSRGYLTTDGEELPTLLFGEPDGAGDVLLHYTLFREPESWVPLPGNPRMGGSIPGWDLTPTVTVNPIIPTKIIGFRDTLLSNPRGFVLVNNKYVPYW